MEKKLQLTRANEGKLIGYCHYYSFLKCVEDVVGG
jgi:hypothetical protein